MNKGQLLENILNDSSHLYEEIEYKFVKGEKPNVWHFQFTDMNERDNARVISRLNALKVENEVTEAAFKRVVDKVTDFMYAMERAFNFEEESVDYETIIEDSIVVRFRNHPKMRLNIYYEEETIVDEVENYEESYLLYERQGRMTLVNDTIENNVDLIRKILAV